MSTILSRLQRLENDNLTFRSKLATTAIKLGELAAADGKLTATLATLGQLVETVTASQADIIARLIAVENEIGGHDTVPGPTGSVTIRITGEKDHG